MAFQVVPTVEDPVKILCETPWKLAVSPFQVSPQTYYVSGQSWVGCYLIDTGNGLLLIDCAIPESLYLLVDSIYSLGYHLTDIKAILISHAHFDHFGGAAALRAICEAPIYMSTEDAEFFQTCPEETMIPHSGSHPQYFTPDCHYQEDQPIQLGNVTITTRLTPGHTVGCTSFFWQETNPNNGDVYTVGMHGGVGANTMNDAYYTTSKYLTPSLRDRFLTDAEQLKTMHIDIALPSHPNQIQIMDRAGSYTHDSQPFLDNAVWPQFLEERIRQVKALMA